MFLSVRTFLESKQEPKMLSYYTQDKNLLDVWKSGKDIYSVIASKAFNVPYEDCLEFYPEGTKINYHGQEVVCGKKTHTNKKGKERRAAAKPVLLGVMYSRGVNSVAEGIGRSKQEAQKIIDDFFNGFPTVKPWMEETNQFAIKNGYVETFTGRRRYIENIQLPEYEFSYIDNKPKDFNPLSFDLLDEYTNEVPDVDKIKYIKLLKNCKGYKDKESIKQRLFSEGIKVKDNTAKVAEALRECVNSRIQGGAADQSKLAMINIENCKELKDLGFRLLIGVHDELIGEAPIENAKRCGELLSECMTSAAYDILHIPQECDVSITKVWYGEELSL